MRYIYDSGRAKMPTGVAKHPYPTTQAWPAQLLAQPTTNYYAPPGSQLTHLGQAGEGPSVEGIVKVVLLLGLAYVLWKLITPRIKGNPRGRNKVAKVWQGSKGWMYKLTRKRAKVHGPFSSRQEAVEDAESKGYGVL